MPLERSAAYKLVMLNNNKQFKKRTIITIQ